jgi:hypothetical protein
MDIFPVSCPVIPLGKSLRASSLPSRIAALSLALGSMLVGPVGIFIVGVGVSITLGHSASPPPPPHGTLDFGPRCFDPLDFGLQGFDPLGLRTSGI